MTLEGEYYPRYCHIVAFARQVAILMTLEGEYYKPILAIYSGIVIVAILMTLEGEYYRLKFCHAKKTLRRNPHDIGRRILL